MKNNHRYSLISLFCACLYLVTPSQAFSGEAGDLCTAVADSDYIVEVMLDGTKGSYPESFAKKQWAPDPKELQKILQTAQIVTVYKGTQIKDTPLVDASLSLPSVKKIPKFWEEFFKKDKIIMLTGPQIQSWLADGGDGKIPAVPYAHLTGYETFKSSVLQCLSK